MREESCPANTVRTSAPYRTRQFRNGVCRRAPPGTRGPSGPCRALRAPASGRVALTSIRCASRWRRRAGRRARRPVCTWPSLSVARTRSWWSPGATSTRGRPLHPGVVGRRPAPASAGCQSPPSSANSTRLDAGVLRPGDAAEAAPARPARRRPTCGTSIREDSLTGPCSDQPRSVQYAVNESKRRDLDVDDPLAGRHVAVEPGHDRPHREPVLDRQRLAVHRDRQHRAAVVGQRRRAACRRSSRRRRSASPRRRRPGRRPRRAGRASADAAPPGVADQVPPTGLETQLSVIQSSVRCRSSRSA